jgi:hypothetical protein
MLTCVALVSVFCEEAIAFAAGKARRRTQNVSA